ncbi:hypothetical protein A0G02_12055 [Pectobacterium peruviense]|uniref:Uncharacterized protein n=1 Tax=Pectobacterium peruviense TaxID=2066479 RepID=A0ABX4S2E0_9GAMM|nr:hypothetical protein G033_15350 [Pectobacterium peruviense]PKX82963.1 hypothetical protein A0G02_12055 [Pectobacterium peruviense]PKX84690.1 hypothetical protein A0G03_19125 [Pectobacterium peruviense]
MLITFNMVWIFDDRIVDGTNFLACRRIVVANALSAESGIDFINVHAHGNGLVRTLRLAHVTVDAFMGDE